MKKKKKKKITTMISEYSDQLAPTGQKNKIQFSYTALFVFHNDPPSHNVGAFRSSEKTAKC